MIYKCNKHALCHIICFLMLIFFFFFFLASVCLALDFRRKNEWFNTNLPDYLKPLPDDEADDYNKIDDDVVDTLAAVSIYSP